MGRKLQRARPDQGARLRELRIAAGLSQYELARQIGEPQSNIAGWELSKKPPRSDVLPMLAQALGVKIENLLTNGHVIKIRRGGVEGKLHRAFKDATRLPRTQQNKIVELVSMFVNHHAHG